MSLKVTALLLVLVSFHCALSFEDDETPTGTKLDEEIPKEDEIPTGTIGDEEVFGEDEIPTGTIRDEEIFEEDEHPKGTELDAGANDEIDKLVEAAPRSACSSYRWLLDYSRAQSYTGSLLRCDRYLSSGWYRFGGRAGSAMPTRCVPTRRCGTHAPGWLSGGHPPLNHWGVRTVCFHWQGHCCRWYKRILVRNCRYFYLYYLSGFSVCNLRYCGNR